MLLNESDPKKRTIRARLYDLAGNALTAPHTFSAGDLKIVQPDGTVANATNLPTPVTGAAVGSFDIVIAQSELQMAGDVRIQLNATSVAYFEWVETVTTNATLVSAVWDEPRTSHTTAGTFGEGINVTSIATAAANTVRDAIVNFSTRTGRTVLGVLRRMDALMTGKTTSMLGSVVTFTQPDGATTEFTLTQDPATSTRTAADVTGSET